MGKRLRLACIIGWLGLVQASWAAKQPNVLLIYSDDHGWADVGAQGVDSDVRTPQLDQLARDGVRFTRGYVTAPQCVPSRAGVLTGQHQNRFGVEDNQKGPLPLDVVTLPERLKQAGYVTGMVGKWHLERTAESKSAARGDERSIDYLPHAHGFDEYWCGSTKQYFASHDLAGRALADAPRLISDNRFRVSVQTEAALSFLDRRREQIDQPWFLYLPWFAPHVPLESAEPWFSRTPSHLPQERRQALAMIAAMDEGLGAIRSKLVDLGMADNTIIFFIGDNGAPLKPGAWNGSLNTTLIGEKGMLTDGGVRVPFVAAWPGRFPAGAVFSQPVSSLDVAATVLQAADLQVGDDLDGCDLLPHVSGTITRAPHAALYWRWRSQASILEFPWKYIYLGSQREYLFNLESPLGESQNLITQHPSMASRLKGKLETWCQTLKNPGLPGESNPQDELFFTSHVEKTQTPIVERGVRGSRRSAQSADLQGWLCRNGAIEQKSDYAVVTADPAIKAAPFLVRTGLSLTGPLVCQVTLSATQAGEVGVAWRMAGEKDFLPQKRVSRPVESGSQWQTIQLEIAEPRDIIHLRLLLPKGETRIRRIELRAARGVVPGGLDPARGQP